MKTHKISYKLGLAFIMLTAGTASFAQRGEERHEPAPQRTEHAAPQRQPQQPAQRPSFQQRPNFQQRQVQPQQQVQRPTVQQRPTFNQRPDVRTQQQPVTVQRQQSQIDRNPARPGVQRFNNPGYRPGFDNRVVASNRVRTNFVPNRPGYRPVYGRNYYRPHYSRPPIFWGGHNYYTRFNYVYHPYRPYYYGSFFHPFGYFALSLGIGAYAFAWENQNYWYDDGIYYAPYNNGYQVVPAPAGAYINTLPTGYTSVSVGDQTYYYFAGTFYTPGANGFEIVDAPPGAVIYDLPEGAKEVKVGDMTYLEYNNAYYQPISLDGRDAYEVVDIEDGNDNQ